MENFDASTGNAGNSVPQIIANNLRVEALLGRGGMGTVYRATHRRSTVWLPSKLSIPNLL